MIDSKHDWRQMLSASHRFSRPGNDSPDQASSAPGRRKIVLRTVAGLLLLGFLVPALATAQQSASRIFITDANASSVPTIQLRLYGVDNEGNAADLSNETFLIRHGGATVDDVQVVGQEEVGTFVIFLLDVPQGVSSQITAIQEAITQYASDPTMAEQVDYVAILKVGATAAAPIMAADAFRNSVRNAFASPLTPESGPTALVDSTAKLIQNLDAQKPKADLVTQLVIISDGTDIVSTEFQAGDVPSQAAEIGLPVNTIWLNNPSLTETNRQKGQEYLKQLADGTGGLAISLSNPEEVSQLWQRIAAFRNQTLVQYTVEDVTGGDFPVEVSLASNPQITDTTTVTVPPGAPTITLEIPADDRELTLPDLNQPVNLSLSTEVAWLDSVERQVEQAQLLVNGIVAQELDPGKLDRFDVQVGNFVFGTNRLQVDVVDDQGNRASSATVILTINQGETQLPEAVQPDSLTDRIWTRIVDLRLYIGTCLTLLVLMIIFIVLGRIVSRSPALSQLGLFYYISRIPIFGRFYRQVDRARYTGQRAEVYRRQFSRYVPEVRSVDDKKGPSAPSEAYLEILEARTRMPSRINLESVEQHLGRSSKQANIVFKDDPTVSRLHATIAQEGSDFRIFDEQSTSGTYVNEQHVPQHGLQLIDGDEIRLGAVRLRFRQL